MRQSISILLVEDNDDDIVLICEAFEQQSLINITNIVRDGEEALSFLKKQGQYANAQLPGLIMLDINMPKMNGFELLQAVKENTALRYLPVVMMTTSDREEDIVRSYAYGACAYISKPPSVSAMMQVISQFTAYWSLVSKVPSAGPR